MICKMCYEEEAIEGESLCQNCKDTNEIQSTEDYMDQLIKDGYISEDGTPLKCSCGCTDFEQTGEYYEEHSLVEYSLNCKSCGKRVGYWAYGNWDI